MAENPLCVFSINSFHNKLKISPRYLEHRVNQLIDDLVSTLLIIEDLYHARKYKEVMMDSTDSSTKLEGSERHVRGSKFQTLLYT